MTTNITKNNKTNKNQKKKTKTEIEYFFKYRETVKSLADDILSNKPKSNKK